MFPLVKTLRVSSSFVISIFYLSYLSRKSCFSCFCSWPVHNAAVYVDKTAIGQWYFIYISVLAERQFKNWSPEVSNCLCLLELDPFSCCFFVLQCCLRSHRISHFLSFFVVANLFIVFHFIRMKKALSILLFVKLPWLAQESSIHVCLNSRK